MEIKDNKTLLQKRERHFFPNQTPYYKNPIQLVKAKGCQVWDEQGKCYLDAIGGIVSISIGHNHPQIQAKRKAMIDADAIQHTTYLYLSEFMADFCEKLASVTPMDLTKCYITNSGSEANEMALLTARAHTGEQVIVALRHAYHGGTNATLGLCGHSTWKYPAQPQASITHAHAPYCYRCPFGQTKDACNLECAKDLKEVIQTTTSGKIAGFFAEPIMGVGGFIEAPLEYLQAAYKIIKEHGGLYISDEVQTGVGRLGKNFCGISDAGVSADIVTMAKGLGNGAPVGAMVTKAEYAKSLSGKLHFNTFGGDPFQSMQAKTVLEILENEKLIENADKVGGFLKEGFKSLQKDFPLIGDVRGRGLLIGLELVKDLKTKTPASDETTNLIDAAKDQGLLIGKGGLYGNVIRVAPPLSLTMEQAKELLQKFEKALLTLK